MTRAAAIERLNALPPDDVARVVVQALLRSGQEACDPVHSVAEALHGEFGAAAHPPTQVAREAVRLVRETLGGAG